MAATPALMARAARELSPQQLQRFQRLDNDAFYVLGSEAEGAAPALATYRVSGASRSVYTIRMYRNGGFFCTCPDMRSHAARHGCVCKHVCFLLARVLRVPEDAHMAFYRGGCRLGEGALAQALQRTRDGELQRRAATLPEHAQEQEQEQARGAFVLDAPPAPDDDCPVCYDALAPEGGGGEPCAACPTCRKGVHVRCMLKWVAHASGGPRGATCVWCRSPAWGAWRV